MKNLEIKKVVQIRAWFTAEEWQLYTSEFPVDSRVAAQALNKELERCVNEGKPLEDTRRFMHSIMRSWGPCGANDSEPRNFLEQVLKQIY